MLCAHNYCSLPLPDMPTPPSSLHVSLSQAPLARLDSLRYILERSEAIYPKEQALALAVAAEALGNAEVLRDCLTLGLEYGATPHEFYEAFLQTYLFAGFPAALEAIALLHTVCKERGLRFDAPSKADIDVAHFQERGQQLCEAIYTTTYSKMRTNLQTLSPDLAEWMIVEGYGKTLSREGVLPRLRELLIVSVLAVTGWKTQLYSHLRGAMNLGAAPIECIDILNNLDVFDEPHIQERVRAAKLVLESVLGRTTHA
ncbi:MAG: hypothetical protein EAZ92_14025 [Candidatus Kapaibacterium sp.]|nr:MAG: hypothetical protein EAZ92_14025 [Candidatus Kapabacteria bacterium]